MVATVDQLEQRGLVTRQPDPSDRRANRVELTARGRTTLVRVTGAVAAAERQLLAPLSTEEQATLSSLLRRVAARASHATDTPAAAPPADSPPAAAPPTDSPSTAAVPLDDA